MHLQLLPWRRNGRPCSSVDSHDVVGSDHPPLPRRLTVALSPCRQMTDLLCASNAAIPSLPLDATPSSPWETPTTHLLPMRVRNPPRFSQLSHQNQNLSSLLQQIFKVLRQCTPSLRSATKIGNNRQSRRALLRNQRCQAPAKTGTDDEAKISTRSIVN